MNTILSAEEPRISSIELAVFHFFLKLHLLFKKLKKGISYIESTVRQKIETAVCKQEELTIKSSNARLCNKFLVFYDSSGKVLKVFQNPYFREPIYAMYDSSCYSDPIPIVSFNSFLGNEFGDFTILSNFNKLTEEEKAEVVCVAEEGYLSVIIYIPPNEDPFEQYMKEASQIEAE